MTEGIVVTGSNGFLGTALVSRLSRENYSVTGVLRNSSKEHAKSADSVVVVGNIDSETDWSKALENQSVVIHTAARAHIMKDEMANPLEEYRKVNVAGTLNLARQAAKVGVKRFVFISSVKVNGESTLVGSPFRADDTPSPEDPYGLSKWEAEQGLWQVARETDMEVVIIRPPLVYGPGVKANFAAMLRLTQKNLPVPLGSVNNQRSLVGIDNLVDLIVTCVDHPAAANKTFLVSDDRDVSTTELLQMMTEAAGKKPRLLPMSAGLLRFGALVLGKSAVADRLLGSLQVDISHTKDTLGWKPPVSIEEGIRRSIQNVGEIV